MQSRSVRYAARRLPRCYGHRTDCIAGAHDGVGYLENTATLPAFPTGMRPRHVLLTCCTPPPGGARPAPGGKIMRKPSVLKHN